MAAATKTPRREAAKRRKEKETENGVRALDFFVYTVTDMERAVAFYRATLGMRAGMVEENSFWTEFDSQPVALALCSPGGGDWRGTPAAALAVRDVRAKVEELRARGVPILAEPEETSVCFLAFVADPDGNRVCLHQRKDGSAG